MWLVSGKNCPMHDNFGERTKVRSGRKYASDMLPKAVTRYFPGGRMAWRLDFSLPGDFQRVINLIAGYRTVSSSECP